MTDDKALHYSGKKLGIDQIPVEILAEVGLVYSYGEQKYARDNWKKGTDWSEFIGSAKRHLAYWEMGERTDPESALPHLAHAIWNLITLLYYDNYSLGHDDRNIGGAFYVRSELEAITARVEAFKAAGAQTTLWTVDTLDDHISGRIATDISDNTPDARFKS